MQFSTGFQYFSSPLQIDSPRRGRQGTEARAVGLSPLPSPLFVVRTPTAVVTDLGTEFGVEVDSSGASRRHVFRGKIELRVADGGNRDPQAISLRENESARVECGAGRAATVIRELRPSNVQAFVRQMHRRLRMKLFNTGVMELKEGDVDPHWQIVAATGDPHFRPRNAVVTVVNVIDNKYLPNGFRSQWISTAGDMPKLPNKATYTFRTTFDLPELVPGTAALRGQFMADDQVTAIRLNGHPVRVPGPRSGPVFEDFQQFAISEGFVEGANTLEIDVLNDSLLGDNAPPNPMLLRVELEGTYTSDGHSSP